MIPFILFMLVNKCASSGLLVVANCLLFKYSKPLLFRNLYYFRASVNISLDRRYVNKHIYILSDSQAVLKALYSSHFISKLVRECHHLIVKLAIRNRIQLIWVPGHKEIEGN